MGRAIGRSPFEESVGNKHTHIPIDRGSAWKKEMGSVSRRSAPPNRRSEQRTPEQSVSGQLQSGDGELFEAYIGPMNLIPVKEPLD